jgi:concanavalin A-like lectin/glucanase superfamily protein
VLADHPVGYWRLGESAGVTAAADAAGSNPGTYSAVTLGTAGAVPGDSAATFAGAGVVTIPATSVLDLSSALSVEAWVNPTAGSENGGIFEKTVGGRTNTQYLLFLEGGAIKFRGRLAGRSGTNTATGPALAAGTWSHVVGTFDGATLRLYVNGALVASAGSSALASGSGAAFIGRLGAEGGSPSIYPFSGALDDVAVYNTALSPARVLAHYAGGASNVTPHS